MAYVLLVSAVSDDEVALDLGELMARHREIGFLLVEHDVDEQCVVGGERADQVVLAAQRDQHVLDLIVEVERLHGLALRAHHLGVAGGGDLEADRPAARGAEHHSAVAIDDAATEAAVDLHELGQGLFRVRHVWSPVRSVEVVSQGSGAGMRDDTTAGRWRSASSATMWASAAGSSMTAAWTMRRAERQPTAAAPVMPATARCRTAGENPLHTASAAAAQSPSSSRSRTRDDRPVVHTAIGSSSSPIANEPAVWAAGRAATSPSSAPADSDG